MKPAVSIEEFGKLDLRVGKVTEASLVENSSKLIKLSVDFGEEQRTVFTGMSRWMEPEGFTGKSFLFIYNLEPKPMMGEESQGMLLAVEGEDGTPRPLVAPEGSKPGEGVS